MRPVERRQKQGWPGTICDSLDGKIIKDGEVLNVRLRNGSVITAPAIIHYDYSREHSPASWEEGSPVDVAFILIEKNGKFRRQYLRVDGVLAARSLAP